jgi:diaminopimelate epimerase
MHGAGNDFVVVDAHGQDRDWGAMAASMGDRHFGVGSDGLILVLPSDKGDLRMRMFNPDGSEAEMCGNGIRCFTKFAVERGLVTLKDGKFRAETMVGVLEVQPIMDGSKVVRARVNQGAPVLIPESVPVDPSQRLVPIGVGHSTAQRATSGGSEFFNPDDIVFDWPVAVPGHSFAVTAVSMGNPHAVTFTDTPVEEMALETFGPMVEHHALFPNRVNFEVVNVVDRTHLTARVWERGAGLTLACGSGACAIAVAARLHGYTDDNVDIELPGGTLSLTWGGQGDVFLEGPVEQVFEGEWPE